MKKQYVVLKGDPDNRLYEKHNVVSNIGGVILSATSGGGIHVVYQNDFDPAPIHLVVAARLRGEISE